MSVKHERHAQMYPDRHRCPLPFLHDNVTCSRVDSAPRTGMENGHVQELHYSLIVFFMVIDPIGNAPILLAVTEAQDRARKLRTALEGTAIATAIMMFFALCGAWIGISTSPRPLSRSPAALSCSLSRWTCWPPSANSQTRRKHRQRHCLRFGGRRG